MLGNNRLLYGLTACHAVNDFYTLILPPLLPALIITFNLSYLQAGIVSFTVVAASALLQPVIGYWADLHRRRKMAIIGGFILLSGGTVAIGLAPSYAALLVACAIIGLEGSTYHPQSTNFLATYFPDAKGRASGIHGIGNSIGFVAASVVAGFLVAVIQWRNTALVLAFPGLAAALLAWWLLREPPQTGSRGLLVGLSRPLALLALVNGLGMLAGSGFTTFLPTFYFQRGSSIVEAGLLTAAMLSMGAMAQPLGGACSDRFGRRSIYILSLAVLVVLIAAFSRSLGLATVLLSLGVGFFSTLTPPVGLIFAAELAAGNRVGRTVGALWGFGVGLSSLAPVLMGYLADVRGFDVAYGSLAAVAMLAAILAFFLPRSSLPSTHTSAARP